MKTYKQVREQFPQLPAWYCQQFHAGLVTILELEGKLSACKAIRSASNAEVQASRDITKEVLLIQAKALCDYIKDGIETTDNEILARSFSVWAWGKQIPNEISDIEALLMRFMNEKKITIKLV